MGGEIDSKATVSSLSDLSVTATASELNIMDGVTATTAELNYNDITTLGTVQASKTVTADANGDVTFPDNEKVLLGISSDLQIYHDGSNSYINDVGTGSLISKSNRHRIQSDGGDNMIEVIADGAVELYHDGNKKIETTTTGINVTGNVISNSQAHDGGAEILAANNNQSTKLKIQGKSSGGTEHNWFLEVARSADEFRIGDGSTTAISIDTNGVFSFENGTTEESTAITSSSNAATINLRDGNVFTHTLSENVTYTFSNPAANGRASAFILKVVQDSSARTITWPGSVDWAAATAPTITATNAGVDVFAFITVDGGTNYYGFTLGQAMG